MTKGTLLRNNRVLGTLALTVLIAAIGLAQLQGGLSMELGDLLLHVVLHSIIAEEERAFTIANVMSESSAKLIRRHPHVFGDVRVSSSSDVKLNWEKIKLTEGRKSLMDGVPKKLPSLLRSHRLQEKASKVGFDWKRKEDVWKKVKEEITELHEAEKKRSHQHLEEEFGDLLFALVNYARFLKINPESALHRSTRKFAGRFRQIEEELQKRGKKLEHSSLEEMDAIWNEGKKQEKHALRKAAPRQARILRRSSRA